MYDFIDFLLGGLVGLCILALLTLIGIPVYCHIQSEQTTEECLCELDGRGESSEHQPTIHLIPMGGGLVPIMM